MNQGEEEQRGVGRGGATCKLVSRSSSAALTSDDGRVNSVRGGMELYDFFVCSRYPTCCSRTRVTFAKFYAVAT